jgi:maltooligosyltrehalose trehalohydrolase
MNVGGFHLGGERCLFSVWAPFAGDVRVRVVHPTQRILPMHRDPDGYWKVEAEGLPPGTRYYFLLEGEKQRPDPASAYQPEGVHGPSEIVDHAAFEWGDANWRMHALGEVVLYELHVGVFTPEGTFDAAASRLDDLLELGVNTLQIMPVAQFPGDRNWGYDGVHPFAVQNTYGGPEGLKRLVDACHRKGMGVVLDVVYNHLGPEGNYLGDFGPYFTDLYRTPWGPAVNFDSAYSDPVRELFIQNALYWFERFHLDGLRLDAVHAIFDMSAKPFLRELAERVAAYRESSGRTVYLIAESDQNDVRLLRPFEFGGCGLDAQWSDDFHHALHALLTGESDGYYQDFGRVEHLARALREGYAYSWQYSPFRKRRHGSPSRDRPASQFVVYSQNHDQVGNRMLGERLSGLVSFEGLKLAAGALILSPFVPMLFMGQEYGEDNPFLYFVSHLDPELVQAVREGRKREFSHFRARGEPPDPQDPETFRRSRPEWAKRQQGRHATLLGFYRELLRLRRGEPALRSPDKHCLEADADEQRRVLFLRRRCGESQVFCAFSFSPSPVLLQPSLPEGRWLRILDSAAPEWDGPGSRSPETAASGQQLALAPESFALYRIE